MSYAVRVTGCDRQGRVLSFVTVARRSTDEALADRANVFWNMRGAAPDIQVYFNWLPESRLPETQPVVLTPQGRAYRDSKLGTPPVRVRLSA